MFSKENGNSGTFTEWDDMHKQSSLKTGKTVMMQNSEKERRDGEQNENFGMKY